MTKRSRQYISILIAIIVYYLIHEGAHLLYALITQTFKSINFLGLGIQIDIYSQKMTSTQLGLFCLMGVLATLCCGYLLTIATNKICQNKNKLFRAIFYYITIVMLLLDPLYLSILCKLFGGGDMNGIALLLPETVARIIFAIILIINGIIFVKYILPLYKKSFSD